MDSTQWIEAMLVVLAAIGLSAACIKHRTGSADYLCGDCRFNSAELCHKEGRPQVTICTSYRPGEVAAAIERTEKQ